MSDRMSNLLCFHSGIIVNEDHLKYLRPVYSVHREVSLVVRAGSEVADSASPAIRLEETITVGVDHYAHGIDNEPVLVSSNPEAHTLLSRTEDLLTSSIYADRAREMKDTEQFMATVMQHVRSIGTYHANWKALSSTGDMELPVNPLITDTLSENRTASDYDQAIQRRAAKLASFLQEAGVLMRLSEPGIEGFPKLLNWLTAKGLAFESAIITDLMGGPFSRLSEDSAFATRVFDEEDLSGIEDESDKSDEDSNDFAHGQNVA